MYFLSVLNDMAGMVPLKGTNIVPVSVAPAPRDLSISPLSQIFLNRPNFIPPFCFSKLFFACNIVVMSLICEVRLLLNKEFALFILYFLVYLRKTDSSENKNPAINNKQLS